MRDVQNEADDRNLAIDRVGISGISWPISVPDRENGVQETVAEVSLSVSLPQDYRGTHMSRFIEVLSAQEKKVTFHNMEGLLASQGAAARGGRARGFDFPYFITKSRARQRLPRPREVRRALRRGDARGRLRPRDDGRRA